MQPITYEVPIQNGTLILPKDLSLPESGVVYIVVPNPPLYFHRSNGNGSASVTVKESSDETPYDFASDPVFQLIGTIKKPVPVMREAAISNALTQDRHFAQEGFVPLLAADE